MITIKNKQKVDFSSINVEGAIKHAHRTTEGWVSLLQELVNNAIGAGATKVEIHCQFNENNKPRVIVRDNGSGIEDFQSAVQYYNGGVNQHSLEGIGLKTTKRFSDNRYIITKTADDKEPRIFDWDNGEIGIYGGDIGDWSTVIVLDNCVDTIPRDKLEEFNFHMRHYFDFLDTKRGEIYVYSSQFKPSMKGNIQLSNLRMGEEYFSTGQVPFGGSLLIDDVEIDTAACGLSIYNGSIFVRGAKIGTELDSCHTIQVNGLPIIDSYQDMVDFCGAATRAGTILNMQCIISISGDISELLVDNKKKLNGNNNLIKILRNVLKIIYTRSNAAIRKARPDRKVGVSSGSKFQSVDSIKGIVLDGSINDHLKNAYELLIGECSGIADQDDIDLMNKTLKSVLKKISSLNDSLHEAIDSGEE